MRDVSRDEHGVYTIFNGTIQSVLPPDTTPEQLTVACLALFGPDMTMPDSIPMHKTRMFLIATNRKTQVLDFLNSLPEPERSMANEEFEYAPDFIPASALGLAAQRAIGLNDVDYAEACRDMAAFNVEDYGEITASTVEEPKPSVLQAIAKFLLS